jgi:spermidine/putrescine transport system ATP-binding protein
MRDIRFENVSKRYNDEIILENFNLTIPSGCFFALLGPSGCGKTTLLRLIAGFETVDSGSIYLGDQNITYVPINKRKINTVFQNYALFPHLNVFNNVAYSLKIKGFNKSVIEEKVIKVLRAVHLEKQIYKNIQQLSGGQQQRVALARAIVNEPEVLLLDEPLAALDQKLRDRLLVELVELQDQLKTTFVYVTHDQSEALTVADNMAIMNYDSEIEQMGTPHQIYEYPKSSFVANFVGSTNVFEGILGQQDNNWFLDTEVGKLNVSINVDRDFVKPGNKVLISLRPEKILISKSKESDFSNFLEGQVISLIYNGRSTVYNVRVASTKMVQVFEQNDQKLVRESIEYDDKVNLYWHKNNAVILER